MVCDVAAGEAADMVAGTAAVAGKTAGTVVGKTAGAVLADAAADAAPADSTAVPGGRHVAGAVCLEMGTVAAAAGRYLRSAKPRRN